MVRHGRDFGTCRGDDGYQQTGGDACPCQGNTKHIFDFRQWLGKYKCESGQACRCGCRTFEASTIIRQTWPELPAGVSYPYIQMASPEQKSQGPFIAFTINAPATPSLIQKYAEEHIKTRLAQLPGIYKINVSGATPMEWRLEYDYEQLRALGVSTDEISQAVGLHYQKEFLGTYDVEQAASGKEWIRLVLMPEHDNREFDAGQIQVKVKDGRIIRLDELVKVVRMESSLRAITGSMG